ncbi:MAG TPA: CHAT domain-containing tetratricopeptide repeat protein [Terriglobales bacterium]
MLRRLVQFVLGCCVGLAAAQATACVPGAARLPGGWRPALRAAAFADPAIPAALTAGYRSLQSSRAAERGAAAAAFQRAETAATAAHDTCGEALAAYALGHVSERSDFAQAERWYQQAAAAFAAVPSPRGVAESHFRLASVHGLQGHEKQSHQEYLAASRELEAAGARVDAISAHVGGLDTSSGDDEYAAVQSQAHALGAGCEEADIFRLWGDHAFIGQHYGEAMQRYVASGRLFAPCSDSAAQRSYLETSMGRLERAQGRPAAALPHYQRALKFQRASGNAGYIPQTYNAMAVAYEAMGNIPEALIYYERGLREARRLHSQPFIDFLGANLGSTYSRHGQAKRGIPLLEAAMAHLHSDFLVCIRADQLGEAYRAVGRLPEAAAQLDNAVAACQREDARAALTGALDDRAQVELQRNQLDTAWADVRRALGLVEESRAHLVPTDAYKAGYISAANTRQTYDLAVTVLMQDHRARQALEVAEQGRARALLDLLASGDTGGAPASRLDAARGGLASPRHAAALDYAAMMAQAIRLHSTIVAYWLTASHLYTWVARPGQPVLGVSQTIASDQLTGLIRASLSDTARPMVWRRLYQLLIAPVEAALPEAPGARLTIVPSGPLFRVAFAALTDARGRYLVERYDLHSTPTVGLLQYTEDDIAAAALRPTRYLFIAAPAHPAAAPDGRPLPPLSGAGAEVQAVAQLLPASSVTTLLGNQATVPRFAAAAPHATVLDFATHAFVDDAQPEKTYLALEDAAFTLDDVYHLRLNARLVVLEACSTGLGRISGDGVAGFSRAFFFAGAASVMATLWDIADRPTAVMLPHFYAALLAGQTPSQALRSAQLRMIADLRAGRIQVPTLRGPQVLPASPRYWAGFTLFGEP